MNVKRNPHESVPPFADYLVRDDKLADFFAKPQLIGTLAWSTASAQNVNLLDFSIKSLLLNAPYADKLKGFGMYRAKFVVRVELNANPFQQGMLLLHYIPNQVDRVAVDPGFLSRVNLNLTAKVQHPSCYIFASDKSVEFEVPYISPSLFYDVVNGKYDWGNVKLDVMLPLATGASGPTDTEVTVFGYFKDSEFLAPVVPQSSNRVVVRKNEDKESGKPVTQGLLAVSKAATALSGIPLISSFMQSAAFSARTVASLTSYFGFSKPRLDSQIMFMTPQPGRHMNSSTGGDQSHPLGIQSDISVDSLDTHSITGMDEMSLAFLKKIPHYVGTLNWTTSQSPDTTLSSLLLTTYLPRGDFTTSAAGHTMSYAQSGPIWYMSNFFRHWRGSMILNVKIAKTKFHTGKLLVAYQPGDKPVAPTNSTSVFCLRNIIDISEQDEFTIEFPYLVWKTWLDTGANVVAGGRAMGLVRISVLNQLRCPETAASTVQLFMTMTYGDDFQFNSPCGPRDVTNGAAYSVQPIVVSPQSGSVVFSSPIASSSKLTINNNPNTKASGDVFSSIKQLYNRMTAVRVILGGASETLAGEYTCNPFVLGGTYLNPTSGALNNGGGAYCDAYSLFAPMYMFHRGTMRLDVDLFSTGIQPWFNTSVSTLKGTNYDFIQLTSNVTGMVDVTSTDPLAIGFTNAHVLGSPTVGYEPISHNETSYLRVPPYSAFPAFILPMQDSRGSADLSTPQANIVFSVKEAVGQTATPAHYGRGPADDWVSSFFLCAPPLLVSYV